MTMNTEAIVDRLLLAAETASGLGRAELFQILSQPSPNFPGRSYLDAAILETWPDLSLPAGAVGILSALSHADVDAAKWDS